MIFKFGRKRFSDVVKVVQFLDKEGIEYEVMADIEVAIVGGSGGVATGAQPIALADALVRNGITPVKSDNDPAWNLARHAGDCGGKGVCKHGTHYGMIED